MMKIYEASHIALAGGDCCCMGGKVSAMAL